MSMRGNNIHFSRATVHHELIPGHHLQGYMTSRYKTYRRLFSTPFWGEGWALYWELLLWDKGFAKSPENRVGMLFWRMHRCARIIFSLSFHLEKMTPKECIDFLVDRVGHERDNATAEVRRSFTSSYGPLYQAAYLLGGMQLRALHRELVESGKMTDRAFHDAVLKENAIPIEMIRASLTDQQLTPDCKPEWKFAGARPEQELSRASGASVRVTTQSIGGFISMPISRRTALEGLGASGHRPLPASRPRACRRHAPLRVAGQPGRARRHADRRPASSGSAWSRSRRPSPGRSRRRLARSARTRGSPIVRADGAAASRVRRGRRLAADDLARAARRSASRRRMAGSSSRFASTRETGSFAFHLGDGPVLGLGEGGPQFDRRGSVDRMRSGQGGYRLRTHGGRVPVPWLIGTAGWAMFVHQPCGHVRPDRSRGAVRPGRAGRPRCRSTSSS